MLQMSFPRKGFRGNGVRGIVPKRDYTRRHMRICTVSFPSSNSLQPKNACILRCAVEGGQGTDGLTVPSVANPKH